MNSSFVNPDDDVVVNPDGEVYNPIDLKDYTFLMISKSFCCVVGIPLNASIALTIIRRRLLHSKPRNIFLLGIIFSYLSFFVPAVIELIYWGLSQDESVCRAYVAIVGVPHGLLLLNMLLALADRYVAIKFPLAHREKMTCRLACGVTTSSSVLLVFFLKLMYIFRLDHFRCGVWLAHVKICVVVLSVPFALCFALNFIVYRLTRTHLRETRAIHSFSNDGDGNRECFQLAAVESDQPTIHAISSRPLAIHVDRVILTRIEMEATRTLIVGVTSLFITACPYFVFVCLFYVCRIVNQSDCSHFNWLAPYMKELGLVHAVYNPFVFLMRNKEMMKAMTCQMYKS